MSSELSLSTEQAAGNAGRHAQLLNALPWLWLGFSAVWAVVIFATNQLAWPLALWIATTLGPLTALQSRINLNEPTTKGPRR